MLITAIFVFLQNMEVGNFEVWSEIRISASILAQMCSFEYLQLDLGKLCFSRKINLSRAIFLKCAFLTLCSFQYLKLHLWVNYSITITVYDYDFDAIGYKKPKIVVWSPFFIKTKIGFFTPAKLKVCSWGNLEVLGECRLFFYEYAQKCEVSTGSLSSISE